MLFEIDQLVYHYPDGTPALEGVTFAVDSREQTVILGSNGSGKSTLLRLLNGLIFATSGQVRFKGEELSEKTFHNAAFRTEFRQSVGFVFQNADAQLFNPTVFEELAFGPRQMGLAEAKVSERVNDVMGFLGITHLAERPPFRMSGGEKRKVAIASVLSMNPDVLLFDEPFLGLDPRSQALLIETIRQLQAAGKTTDRGDPHARCRTARRYQDGCALRRAHARVRFERGGGPSRHRPPRTRQPCRILEPGDVRVNRFGASLLLAGVILVSAGQASVRSDIQRQYHRWAKAALSNDVETILSILAPDYSLHTYTGTTIDRAAYEASLRKRKAANKPATAYQTKINSVTVLGSTAKVISDETSEALSLDPVTNKNVKLIHIHRYLDTWIRVGRIWRLQTTVTQVESTTVAGTQALPGG